MAHRHSDIALSNARQFYVAPRHHSATVKCSRLMVALTQLVTHVIVSSLKVLLLECMCRLCRGRCSSMKLMSLVMPAFHSIRGLHHNYCNQKVCLLHTNPELRSVTCSQVSSSWLTLQVLFIMLFSLFYGVGCFVVIMVHCKLLLQATPDVLCLINAE